MEAQARKAYEAHIQRILIEKMNLDFTGKPEEKKQFDEDVASLFVLKEIKKDVPEQFSLKDKNE